MDVSLLIWRVEHFDEIDSTNTYVVRAARAGAREGLVCTAGYQSIGRGRLERRWEAPPFSSLLCSILLQPEFGLEESHLALATVALAARAALVRLSGVRPDLKWPNDLVVGPKKLAGILAEVVEVDAVVSIVVGLGVNLTYEGPDGVDATSIRAASGLTIDPRALLDIVLEELEVRRALWVSVADRARLREEYRRALVTIGQRVRVEQAESTTVGRAVGVDRTGRLEVEVDGVIRTFDAGDVVHLRPEGVAP